MANPRFAENDLPEGTHAYDRPFDAAVVTDALRAFDRALRANQLYLANNPMHARAMEAAASAFRLVWNETECLTVQIGERCIEWCGKPLLEELERGSETLHWLLYKDGIRELSFRVGFETTELERLLGLMQRARLSSAEEDDLLTLLWEHEFECLDYRYVEVAQESQYEPVTVATPEIRKIAPPTRMDEIVQTVAASSIARMEEYDSTLYFLEEAEIEYLRSELARDFASDLRPGVIAALLDTFEQECDPTAREEISSVLEQMFVVLLSSGQFGPAAYLMREARVTAERCDDATAAQRERLRRLPDTLSEADALRELLSTLEETPLKPPQPHLNELLLQLLPTALEPVLAWLARTTNAELGALLENAASRIAAHHSSELVRLILCADTDVALQAVRRAGVLKTLPAVPSLARVLSESSRDMRLAAVTALNHIASPGAMQVLERALEDVDRDVRIAAARAIGARGHRGALQRIEERIRSASMRSSTLSEKVAFFEAYGSMCGDAGVAVLDSILHSRRLLRVREDAEVRGCAAMALGRVGTPRAVASLERAEAERDVVVRSAVSRALRTA